MRLVPRQLRRTGMAGGVPYYGGRLTPTVAHAIDHPGAPIQTQWHPGYQMASGQLDGRPLAPAPAAPLVEARSTRQQLDDLLARGVLTAEEHGRIVGRLPG